MKRRIPQSSHLLPYTHWPHQHHMPSAFTLVIPLLFTWVSHVPQGLSCCGHSIGLMHWFLVSCNVNSRWIKTVPHYNTLQEMYRTCPFFQLVSSQLYRLVPHQFLLWPQSLCSILSYYKPCSCHTRLKSLQSTWDAEHASDCTSPSNVLNSNTNTRLLLCKKGSMDEAWEPFHTRSLGGY